MERIKREFQELFKTGFFHIFGSGVINKILGFLSSIILVRILTKAEYGVFTYSWNIYSIVILFSGMGVESGVLQLVSEHSGDSEFAINATNYGTRFGLAFNAFLATVLLFIGLFIPLKVPEGKQLLCILCFLPVCQLLCNMMCCYLRSQKRNQEYSILSIVNTLLLLLSSAGCAYVLREIGLVIGYYIAAIGTFLIGKKVYKIRLVNQLAGNLGEDSKSLLKISFISMINNSLSGLMYLLDVFILGIVDPQETLLASYKVATIIPTALTFIPTALVIYIYPYYAEHRFDRKWCIDHYKKILLGMGLLNLVISLFLFSFAPIIVNIVFGSEYLDAVTVFRILSINYFISGTFRTISGNLLVTQRKLKFNLLVAIVSSMMNIVADYFFIQWWGSKGAAIATVLVVLVSSIMSTSYLLYTFNHNKMHG